MKLSFNDFKRYTTNDCIDLHKSLWKKYISEDLNKKIKYSDDLLRKYIIAINRFDFKRHDLDLCVIIHTVFSAVLHKVYGLTPYKIQQKTDYYYGYKTENYSQLAMKIGSYFYNRLWDYHPFFSNEEKIPINIYMDLFNIIKEEFNLKVKK